MNITLADHFNDQLEIKIKAITFKIKIIRAVTLEYLEHPKWVFHALTVEHIDNSSEKYVSEIEGSRKLLLLIKGAYFPFTAMPVTEHKWLFKNCHRLKQGFLIVKIVFKISILN